MDADPEHPLDVRRGAGSLIVTYGAVPTEMGRPRKPKGERKLPLAVYLPERLLKKLREKAGRDHRAASTQAFILIEEALEG